MSIDIEFRGISKERKTWVYGFYYEEAAPLTCIGPKEEPKGFIIYVDPNSCSDWNMPRNMIREEVDKDTVGRYTGLMDRHKNKLYQEDIIKSNLNNVYMVIKFGEYRAYCPADDEYMINVGFYAKAKGYPSMPLGPTDKYAELVGNIYENPDCEK